MRFLFRWAFRLFLVLVVLIVALVLLKDSLAQSFLEHRIRTDTGLDTKIGSCKVGLFSPSFTLENVKLYNPPEFGGSLLLDLPELHVVGHRAALALGRLHLKFVRLNVQELHLVEGRDGQTNTVAVLDRVAKQAPRQSRDLAMVLGMQFKGIDTLNLSLGRIRYSSLRRPGREHEVKLGLRHEILTGINSWSQLSDAVLSRMLNRGITLTSQGGSGGGDSGDGPNR